jgi:hypothetical protein
MMSDRLDESSAVVSEQQKYANRVALGIVAMARKCEFEAALLRGPQRARMNKMSADLRALAVRVGSLPTVGVVANQGSSS